MYISLVCSTTISPRRASLTRNTWSRRTIFVLFFLSFLFPRESSHYCIREGIQCLDASSLMKVFKHDNPCPNKKKTVVTCVLWKATPTEKKKQSLNNLYCVFGNEQKRTESWNWIPFITKSAQGAKLKLLNFTATHCFFHDHLYCMVKKKNPLVL